MKKHFSFLLFLCLWAFNAPMLQAQISEGFETNSCGNLPQAFFTGCFPSWTNASGSSDASSNYPGISPTQGSRYAHMYVKDIGFCGTNSNNDRRSEGILLNYNFQAGTTYDIEYDMRWTGGNACFTIKSEWILTNGRSNQSGGSNSGCNNNLGEITPLVSSGDQIIKTHSISSGTGWTTHTVSFTPTSNYSQLWLRHEAVLRFNCGINAQISISDIFLDDFNMTTCDPSGQGYTTLFGLAPSSNFNGNVSVNCFAYSNPGPVNHWWDVYYAPGGSTSGNNQVPGNPTITFSTTAFFNQNMFVNEWYYVKHGIWSDCINWRETRKRFRVQVRSRNGSEEPQYEIQVEDLTFEAEEAYVETMTQLAREGRLEEINNSALSFANKSEQSISNQNLKNFPNPFQAQTTISFDLAEAGAVHLSVRDLSGRLVKVLEDSQNLVAGQHQYDFTADGLVPGVYYYTLQTKEGSSSQKMMILP